MNKPLHLVFSCRHRSPDYTFTNEPIRVSTSHNGERTVYYADHPRLGCGKDAHSASQAIVNLAADHGCKFVSSALPYVRRYGYDIRFDMNALTGEPELAPIRNGGIYASRVSGDVMDGDKSYFFHLYILPNGSTDLELRVRTSKGARAVQDGHKAAMRQCILLHYRDTFETPRPAAIPAEYRAARDYALTFGMEEAPAPAPAPTELDPVDSIPAYAVIIRAIWERGETQEQALEELKRRGLWLSAEQKIQAGIA